MKMKTLAVLAGIGAPLIATAASEAGFVGINAIKKPNVYNLMVLNVYAEFDNPGNDFFQAVAGTENQPLDITVIGGTFYNHNFGTDVAPSAALVAAFPSLAFDSFYTIGQKLDGPGDMVFVGDLPDLTGSVLHAVNGAYGIVPGTPPSNQDNPFDPVNSYPGNGSILIGQFAMAIPDPITGPYGIMGQFLIQYKSDGVVQQSYVSFENIVPTPGALGLLGVAGLIGRRRRRR